MGFLDFFDKEHEDSIFLKLIKTIEDNNVNKFKKLIEKGNFLYKKDEDGFTLLHHAAFEGNFEIIDILMENNIDIDTPANNGHTPLSLATEEGHLDLVKKLLKAGAELKTYKDDLNWTFLHLAIDSENIEMVKFFLNKGIDVNLLDLDGDTPFILAASIGALDIVKYLIENGADMNILNKENQNALHEAVYTGFLDVTKYLIEIGVDKNIKNKSDQTPLDIAKESEFDDIVEYLESLS